MATTNTYVVQAGDTLSSIASKFNTTVSILAKINNIEDVNLIYVGQVLIISRGDGSTDPKEEPEDYANRVVINNFGLQSNTDRTVFATWIWSKDNTEHYQIIWDYYTNGIWFSGEDTTVEKKNTTYNAPANAESVRFRAIPVAKKHKVNGKETAYWTGEWSTYSTYSFSNNPPAVPSVPTVEITDYKLTAKLDNISDDAKSIQFEVVKDNTISYKKSDSTIKMNYVQYSCYVDAGSVYKVRCRAVNDSTHSEWTDYSANVSTKPSATSGITTCKATSETSIFLAWDAVSSADTYDIEYTTKKEYFNGSDGTTIVNGIKTTQYEFTGLETGDEYFFRVRAVNTEGESAWSGIKSVIIGKAPTSPTTWSSTTTCITGEPLTLHWMHNCEDGSTQTAFQIKLTVNGHETVINKDTSTEEDDEKTMYYDVKTSTYSEGSTILWQVRTAGVTNELGEWSIERTVDIYTPPTLSVKVTNSKGNELDGNFLKSFPFYVKATAGPETQKPTSYHVTITSDEVYETIDRVGNEITVNSGQEVYSQYFDTSKALTLEISANSVDLHNNINYTLSCTVAMDSGLTATDTYYFTVSWDDQLYHPNAEISYDPDTYTTSIMPYCKNNKGAYIAGVTLSVYRREFDGSFTELMSGIDNESNTFITDPHPSLDYARYRIVAIANSTGAVSYYDVPGYPVGETAIIIQWDEAWSSFDVYSEDAFEQPTWAGSLIRLPYNIDISEQTAPDTSLVRYIGRARPVGYYGTQLGESATWNTVIPKSDTETLYALRRLATWMGNVYVREPSGSGYWANIVVSFNRKHSDLTIPITLKLTRVEGGA